MKNIADLNIDIADLMIICGHMQKEINSLKSSKDFWAERCYEAEKERDELKAKIDSLVEKYAEGTE
jgi:uncharacterized coiled-coil DUF342 family protein